MGAGESVLPGAFPAAGVVSAPPPLATSVGAAAGGGGLGSGYELHPAGAFAGLGGGPAERGDGAGLAGHFPGEPVPGQRLAGGAFGSASSSAASGSFGHPAAEPPAGAAGPDPRGAALAGHDQPGLGEPGGHAGIELAAVDPAVDPAGPGAGGAGEHEEASGVHSGSPAGWAAAPSGHDPGTDTPVSH